MGGWGEEGVEVLVEKEPMSVLGKWRRKGLRNELRKCGGKRGEVLANDGFEEGPN